LTPLTANDSFAKPPTSATAQALVETADRAGRQRPRRGLLV